MTKGRVSNRVRRLMLMSAAGLVMSAASGAACGSSTGQGGAGTGSGAGGHAQGGHGGQGGATHGHGGAGGGGGAGVMCPPANVGDPCNNANAFCGAAGTSGCFPKYQCDGHVWHEMDVCFVSSSATGTASSSSGTATASSSSGI